MTVVRWYVDDRYKLDRIVFYDGAELATEEIEALAYDRIDSAWNARERIAADVELARRKREAVRCRRKQSSHGGTRD